MMMIIYKEFKYDAAANAGGPISAGALSADSLAFDDDSDIYV